MPDLPRQLENLWLAESKPLFYSDLNGARRVEPNEQNGKETATGHVAKKTETAVPCHSPPCPGLAGEDVARVVLAWAKLPESIRAAILTLVDAAKNS